MPQRGYGHMKAASRHAQRRFQRSEDMEAFFAFLDDYWPLWRQHEGSTRWHDLRAAFLAGRAEEK